jgi:hypothetical protein
VPIAKREGAGILGDISMPRIFSAIVTSVSLAFSAHAGVVINELMLRPGASFPENIGREFVELHNTDTAAVDVSGWMLNSGVNFTFPAGTTIPAGGYLLVAGDPAAATAAYGRNDFFGPWTGSLSNNSERVRLSKPGAVAGTVDRVDEVTYATEGDWATRVRLTTGTVAGGWGWQTGTTAGFSLELRNPALSNDNGQNWAASNALNGTPGTQNSVFAANVAPIIKAVKHAPAVPKSSEPVTISCELNDETAATGLGATLFWRNATTTSPAAFSQVPMAGDGSGRFSAILPPMPNLTVVEFYISAGDGALTRTWPAPTSEGQNANCQYQVDNEVDTTTDSYYRLVLTASENAAYNAVASSSDREFNQTLISSRGGETTIRYRAGMRIRGNSSRTYATARPLRISIPNDDPWDGVTDFNLHIKASYLQFLGLRLMAAAGLPSSNALPVEVRRNGVEYTTNTGSTPDFGKWVRVEPENKDYVARNWPEADTGNLYTKRSPERYWRSAGWAVPTTPDGLLDTWSKQNNSDANDWSDLTNFFTVVQQIAAPHFPLAPATDVSQSNGGRLSGVGAWAGTPFNSTQMATLETVADLDHWAKWFAVMTILQDLETNISNGVDDDYGIYFVPDLLGRRRAHFAVHDLDTIFGRGDNRQAANYTDLFDMTEDGQSDYAFRTLLPLFGTTSTPGNAQFIQKYKDSIRALYGSFFNADTTGGATPPFHRFVDEHLSSWAAAPGFRAEATAIKTFATARQAHLLGLIGQGPLAPPPATASSTLVATPGTILISEVLASNVAAHQNAGLFPDVIELTNTGAAPVDLAGYTLTDDTTLPAKFTFPAGTLLAPGQFLVIYADSATTAPGLHAGFSLNQRGDRVELRDGSTLVDSVVFGPQVMDRSISRTGATLETWALCEPTIGTVNSAPVALGPPSGLRINEWGANPDHLLGGDFVELFNPAADPTPIGGMRITDDPANYPARHIFPPLSFISGGGFLYLEAEGSGASPDDPTELGFGLDSTFGFIALSGENGTLVDRVDVIGQPRDMSQGRSPDGGDTIARFSLPGQPPTPGASNVVPPSNILNLISSLRVTEFLFRPNAIEFIELQNLGNVALDLSGVEFTEGITYRFEDGTMLPPGAYIVVCKDRAAFAAQYGMSTPLAAGVFTGSLDNGGETVTLQTPAPFSLNILSFSYKPDWFFDSTGDHSFTIFDPLSTAARDWTERESWRLSVSSFGTPGSIEKPIITSVLAVSFDAGRLAQYQLTATNLPSSYDATGLPNGFSIEPTTGLISGASTVDGVFNVTLSATNASGTSSATLVITLNIPPTPVISSPLVLEAGANLPISYQIAASNTPTIYGAAGLPGWLSINTNTGLISGTPTSLGTFPITISATNYGGTDSETLTVTILPPGPLASLRWEPVADQLANAPFTATIRAIDANGRLVDFNDTATISAVGASEMGVVLTEFGASAPTPDYFELQNLGPNAVNTTGWFVMTSRSTVGVNSVNATSWLLPASIAPGQVIGATDGTPGPGETLYGADIDWVGDGPRGWAMLADSVGNIRDFVAWGYTAAEIATINFTHRGFTFTVGTQWAGDGAARHFAGTSLFRTGNIDSQDASNWSVAATPSPRGAQNSGLFPALPISVLGGVKQFTNGTWTGTLNILSVGSARLTANTGGLPIAFSNALNVAAPSANTPPLFTKGNDQTIPMDSGAKSIPDWATGILPGASTESSQSVSFEVSASNPALFASGPTVAANGTLTYTPALHASGSALVSVVARDNGGTAGGGVDASTAQTFTIDILPNVAPSFVKGADRTEGEATTSVTVAGWASSISAGPGETGQAVNFSLTATNPALFSIPPAMSSTGTLTYTLTGGMRGISTVSIALMDDGGTANGGSDTSALQTFTISVVGVNAAPTFTKGADISVRHNAGGQVIPGWATNISAGPAEESAQTLAFEVTASNPNLFVLQPSISPSGTLSFLPHPVRGGTSTITVTLRDNGGTLGGGLDSSTQTFTITTRAVNDAPSFTGQSALVVGIGSDYAATYASNISPGPEDEAAQTVSFLLSNNRPDLFTSQPTLLPGGVLTFTAGNVSGTAVFTIRAKDNGGIVDGGVDESAPVQLTVRIASALEATGTYYALIGPDTGLSRSHENSGFIKLTLSKTGGITGAIVLGGEKFSIKGKMNDTGFIAFASGNPSTVLNRKLLPDVILTLTFTSGASPIFSAIIKPPGNTRLSRFAATRPQYDGRVAPVPQRILDPLADKGRYTAAFLALTAPNNGFAANSFPQGDGPAALTISKTGAVKLKGKLADGTAFSMASAILAGDTVPLHCSLYAGKGSLSGHATLRDLPATDADGAAFYWSRPAILKPAHPGWALGIFTDFAATKLLPKATPIFPGLSPATTTGNALADLSDAGLGSKAVNIEPKNKVSVVTPAADKLKVTLSATNGNLGGSFVAPATGKTVKFSGVLLRKSGVATGYYLDGIPGGRIQVMPTP